MDYKEQYQHPMWQKKRLEILERDNYICMSCTGGDDQLHVHHKTYKNDYKVWEYDNSNFLTLCNECHLQIHSIKSDIKYVIDMSFTIPDTASYIHSILVDLSVLHITDLHKLNKLIHNAVCKIVNKNPSKKEKV